MGSTASVTTVPAGTVSPKSSSSFAAGAIQKKYTHEEFQAYLGSKYSLPLYTALCDENGKIDQQILDLLSRDGIEREVLSLYLEYCPDGTMKCGIFVKFCVECRLLSKRNFSRKDAEVLFQKYMNVVNEQINYHNLRYQIVHEISALQHTSPYQLLSKISVCEGPNMESNEPTPATNNSNTNTGSERSVARQISIVGEKLTTLTPEQAEIVRKACIQLQKLTRSTLAAKEIKARKERRKLSVAAENSNILRTLQPPSTLEEKTCLDLFHHFSPNEEMSLQEFLNFCHHTSLIPSSTTLRIKSNFTKLDAQNLFKNALARCYDPKTNTYLDGVKFGKRILYSVFRLLVIPEIAARKHLSVEELLQQLIRMRQKMEISFEDDFIGSGTGTVSGTSSSAGQQSHGRDHNDNDNGHDSDNGNDNGGDEREGRSF